MLPGIVTLVVSQRHGPILLNDSVLLLIFDPFVEALLAFAFLNDEARITPMLTAVMVAFSKDATFKHVKAKFMLLCAASETSFEV